MSLTASSYPAPPHPPVYAQHHPMYVLRPAYAVPSVHPHAPLPPALAAAHQPRPRTNVATVPAPAPVPGSWRTPGHAWTAELDMALVRAFCRHSAPSSSGAPPSRNFWPAVVKDIMASNGPLRLSHEDEREMCDSSRHRLKRLRQYAAQIHLILNHPSGTFVWHASSARVVPAHAPAGDAASWSLIGQVKLRHRVRDGIFAWYPLLAAHIDQSDLVHASSPTLFAAGYPPSPMSPTTTTGGGMHKRSFGSENNGSESTNDELPTTTNHNKRARSDEPSEQLENKTTVSSEESFKQVVVNKMNAKRTWTAERDTALVECYMANRFLIPTEPSARPTSSVWRRIVREVFGSTLTTVEEREAGDSARHRLKKLRGYAAQVHKLLSTRDRLFVWNDTTARLEVNTTGGHEVEVTWSKIRNPQVRNRLIRAHYPWLHTLAVTDADLPSTFYSTTLSHDFFVEEPLPRSSSGLVSSSYDPRFLSPRATGATVGAGTAGVGVGAPITGSSAAASVPMAGQTGLASPPTDMMYSSRNYRSPSNFQLPPSRYSPPMMPLPSLTSGSSSDPSAHSVVMHTGRSPGTYPGNTSAGGRTLPPLRTSTSSPTGLGFPAVYPTSPPGSHPSHEETGSVTRSSRIILTDLQLGMFASQELGRRYLLLLPRLDRAQRELFESVRQFGTASHGDADAQRARQAYALLDDWL